MFKIFCYTTISILPQNQEKLLNIWLKQTFQKAIMYFKTSEQKILWRNLRCYLHYFQYQMRSYGCIFTFPNTKIRENVPCYINLIYQVSTFCSKKSLSNQTGHLWLLKSNVTNGILKLPWKQFEKLLYCIQEN